MSTTLDVNKLCLACMRMRPDENPVCPHCGANGANLQNPPHQLAIFSILKGQYLVGKSLGQGGFGITYVGYDLLLDMRVAIKEYYPEGFVCRQATLQNSQVLSYTGHKKDQFLQGRESFLTEARVLAKLGALPHVVHVRDFFQENGTAYIVMEYVEGETLKKRLQRNGDKLPFNEVMELVRPVMHSLGKIHNMGLLHRDISPDNIIIRENGDAVLLDFGAAVEMEDAMQHSIALNVKHGYAPIEQYTQHSNLGPWSDVYAMSATVYRAITGQVPPQSIERAHGGANLKGPNSLGAGLTSRQEKALVQGLSVYAKDRIQSMEELATRLSGGKAPKPAKDVSDAAGEKTGKGKTGLIIGLVCAVLAAGAGTLAVLQPWKNTATPQATSTPVIGMEVAVQQQATEAPAVIQSAQEAPPTMVPASEITADPAPKVTAQIPEVTAVVTDAPTQAPTQAPTEAPTPEPEKQPEATRVVTATPVPNWRSLEKTGYADLGLLYSYYQVALGDLSGAQLAVFISEEDHGALLAGYLGSIPADGTVVVPDSILYNNNEYPVIALCDDFLEGAEGLKALYLPDSLEYISHAPFANVAGLTIGGNKGTAAQRFAEEMGYSFQARRFPPEVTATPEAAATPVPTAVPQAGSDAAQSADAAQKSVMIFEEDKDGLTLIGYTGTSTELVIPAQWEGKNVIAVKLAPSDAVRKLTSVTIPEGVVTIYSCLNVCPELKEVSIPSGVNWISPGAFKDTPWMEAQLKAARKGDGLLILGGDYLVAYVGKAEEITLPDEVRVIGNEVFLDNQTVRRFTGGKGLASIRDGAFAGMTALEAFSLPKGNGELTISSKAFTGTNNLRALALSCRLVGKLTLEEDQLSGLQFIYLTNDVTLASVAGAKGKLGSVAFLAPDHKMTKAWQKAGFTVVKSNSQTRSKRAMEEMGWPDVTYRGDSNFMDWDFAINPADGTVTLLNYRKEIKELKIPEKFEAGDKTYTVVALGPDFMAGKQSLESITLPDTIQRIGEGALNGCIKLRTVDFGKAKLVLEPGALRNTFFAKNNKEVIDSYGRLLMVTQNGNKLTISNKVKAIASYALYGTDYSSVKLPDGLKEIESFAMMGMSKLEELVIPDGVERIGHLALANTKLERLRLPASVKEVGSGLLTGTSAKLYGKESVTSHLKNEGYQLSPTEKVRKEDGGKDIFYLLDHNTGTAGAQIIDKHTGSVELLAEVEGMPVVRVLRKCGNGCGISQLTIPGSITEVISGSFCDMPNLQTVVLKEGCTGFDGTCFLNCPKLAKIQLPKSVTDLPEQAPKTDGVTYYVVKNSEAHAWAERLGLNYKVQ